MEPREAKAIFHLDKGLKFTVKETLSKLYKVENFFLMKELIQK